MDTSVASKTDRLGRRIGRRKYSLAEKLQIVEETRAPRASVADVARAHGVNAPTWSLDGGDSRNAGCCARRLRRSQDVMTNLGATWRGQGEYKKCV